MKSNKRVFALVVIMVGALLYTTSMSASPSLRASSALISPVNTAMSTPMAVFQSPLAAPGLRSEYVGRELVMTQEAQYVIKVAATRSAVATLTGMPAITPTPMLSPVSSPQIPALLPRLHNNVLGVGAVLGTESVRERTLEEVCFTQAAK